MIQTVELFSDLSARELADIDKIATRKSFARGDYVFKQGEHSRDLYVIETGQVEILVKTIMQDQKVVSTLKNGDLLGEMAMFDRNAARSASARVTQNSVLIMIPGSEFERLLKERPTLSFKLLGTLSRRLRQANLRDTEPGLVQRNEAKVIVTASPRDGVGKTCFAATVAHLLSTELDRKVLYLDLDLTFADGTFFMGVYSIRSIIDMAGAISGETMEWQDVRKFVIANNDRLFTLPGPVSLIDGERLRGEDLVKVIRVFRKHVDYIVIDTESKISDAFLGALDLADHVYFLVDVHDLYSLKTSARYFHGMSKLNLSEQRLTLVACHADKTFTPAEMAKLFKLPVGGQLPMIPDYQSQYGVTPYIHAAKSDYCQVVRGLLTRTFQVNFPAGGEAKGFFARLFTAPTANGAKATGGEIAGAEGSNDPAIVDSHLTVLLKYVRLNLKNGQIDEAYQQVTQLLSYCNNSSLLYQTYGEILARQRNYSEAVSAFQRALQLNPSNYVALGNLGVLGRNDAMIEQARTLLRKRITEKPRWPDLHIELGVLEHRVGNHDEAVAEFKRSLDINPSYTEASVWLAEAHYSRGRFDLAIDVLAGLREKSVRGYVLFGDCLHAEGLLADALRAYRRAAQINNTYEGLADKVEALDKHFIQLNHLIEMHRELVGVHPTHPDLHLKLGELLAQVGLRDEARNSLQRALELKPDLAPAKLLLEEVSRQSDRGLSLEYDSVHAPEKCAGVSCDHYRLELRNGSSAKVSVNPTRLEHRRLRLRNVRTGRTTEVRLNGTLLGAPSTLLNPNPLCPLEVNDVVLATLLDPATNVATFAWPIQVTGDANENTAIRSVVVDLAVPLAALGGQLGATVPARFFLLTCDRQSLGENDVNSNAKVTVTNPRTQRVVHGRVDPEQADNWQFVMLAEADEDIVANGDQLIVQRFDDRGVAAAELTITVTPDDLRTFQKIVGIDRHPATNSKTGRRKNGSNGADDQSTEKADWAGS